MSHLQAQLDFGIFHQIRQKNYTLEAKERLDSIFSNAETRDIAYSVSIS